MPGSDASALPRMHDVAALALFYIMTKPSLQPANEVRSKAAKDHSSAAPAPASKHRWYPISATTSLRVRAAKYVCAGKTSYVFHGGKATYVWILQLDTKTITVK